MDVILAIPSAKECRKIQRDRYIKKEIEKQIEIVEHEISMAINHKDTIFVSNEEGQEINQKAKIVGREYFEQHVVVTIYDLPMFPELKAALLDLGYDVKQTDSDDESFFSYEISWELEELEGDQKL